MSKIMLITIVVLMFGGTIVTADSQTREAKRMIETPEKQLIPLSQRLIEIGEKHDRFFTIEEGWKGKESMNALEAYLVKGSSPSKSFQQELEQLRQTVPNFTYQMNKANPKVIHIIDARLKQQEGYSLESTVRGIDFTGTTNELVDALASDGISVSVQRSLFLNEFQDYGTTVQVKGEELRVRDALSNFISLDDRVNILWVARTKLGSRQISYIHYPWPGKKK